MTSIHIEPIVYTARFYEGDNKYENYDPYIASITIQRIGNTAYLSAFNGAFKLKHLALLAKQLKEIGILNVYSIRNGKTVEYSIDRFIKHLGA